jgi:tRNA U34 5-carboxymethylaminomethyl modifying GTPase MnmE/TrmE
VIEGIEAAQGALKEAEEVLTGGLGEDALACELREAIQALARSQNLFLHHDRLTESLLDRIFADFCIGK